MKKIILITLISLCLFAGIGFFIFDYNTTYQEKDVKCIENECFDLLGMPITGKVIFDTPEYIETNTYKNGYLVSSYKKYIGKFSFYRGKEYSTEDLSNFNNDTEISNEKFNKMKQALDKSVEKYKTKNGSFIIMDASDATILSTYTTKDNDEKITFPWLTRLYEAGSIWKVFNTAMALESKMFTINDKINASEPLKLKYHTIKDYNGENRELTLEEVLVYSSNIASAKIALTVGAEYQYDFLKKLGLFNRINDYGINTPSSLSPIKSRWSHSESTRATIAYGYGLSTTPLHLITAYSAIINGGIYQKPSFERFNNKEKIRVISESNSKQMKEFLRSVVVNGAGKRANINSINVMGKTGTANKLNEEGQYEDKKVRTTFIGNFEHNSKQYAILVILDEPQPLEETYNFVTSGWNAVPTAREIIEIIIDN